MLTTPNPPLESPLEAIVAGRVRVNGVIISNRSRWSTLRASMEIGMKLAPLGIQKLGYALDTFTVNVTGHTCLDLGACNGGSELQK